MSTNGSKTVGKTFEETKKHHEQYLRAVNNPIRREILKAIRDGSRTFQELKSHTGLDDHALNWHMSLLEQGFCIERVTKDGRTVYLLTQEGKVIKYLK